MSDPSRVYLVVRVGWRVRPRDNHTHFLRDYVEAPEPDDRRFVPVAAFDGRAQAEARLRELELEAARAFNPFLALGPIDDVSRHSADEVVRQLAAIVSPLPASDLANTVYHSNRKQWLAWWDEYAPTWPDDKLAKVWELFDRVHFYAILEVNAE